MTITVAPLTTVVMASISQNHAGIASGINNAIARTAGLIAIAVFGIVMLQVFKQQLNRRMTESALPNSVVQVVQAQQNKLAAIVTPEDRDVRTREILHRAIAESFVIGFKTIMAFGAILALGATVTGLVLIRTPPSA